MSRVDVVVPCYNYGRFLGGCVESVLSQEGVEVRVLIIDDASADETPAVAEALADRDVRVEFRRHPANRGHIATYNEGLLGWAEADYSLLLSADDLLTPGALARAAALLHAHPEVGLTFGRQIVLRSEEPPPAPPDTEGEHSCRIIAGRDFLASCCSSASNPVETPTAVVRTDVQKRIGGYRADLPHTADLELWLRFAAAGDVGVIEADQAFKRSHATSMQREYLRQDLGDLAERRAAFDAFFRGQGDDLPGRGRLERAVYRGLAMEAFWGASRAFEQGEPNRCHELLEYAVGLDRTLPGRPEWRRLRLKRAVGPAFWRRLGPWIDRLRGPLPHHNDACIPVGS
jgi:glycosyltransferase involved in cell wall biosynthesis